MSATKGVIIGVDPHKMSATIEVVDANEHLLGTGRLPSVKAGYSAMRAYVKQWSHRTWAVEGASGADRRWPSAWSRTASMLLMCRPSLQRG